MTKANSQIKYHKIVLLILAVSAIFGLLNAKIYAQAGQAELVGEISDPNGAVILNARVLLTEKKTNRTTQTVSDTNGYFIFTNQKPGIY